MKMRSTQVTSGTRGKLDGVLRDLFLGEGVAISRHFIGAAREEALSGPLTSEGGLSSSADAPPATDVQVAGSRVSTERQAGSSGDFALDRGFCVHVEVGSSGDVYWRLSSKWVVTCEGDPASMDKSTSRPPETSMRSNSPTSLVSVTRSPDPVIQAVAIAVSSSRPKG